MEFKHRFICKRENGLQRMLWEDLNVSSNKRKWLTVGDFNSILTAEEQCDYNSFNVAGSHNFHGYLFLS